MVLRASIAQSFFGGAGIQYHSPHPFGLLRWMLETSLREIILRF
jgi:hypothetical protein